MQDNACNGVCIDGRLLHNRKAYRRTCSSFCRSWTGTWVKMSASTKRMAAQTNGHVSSGGTVTETAFDLHIQALKTSHHGRSWISPSHLRQLQAYSRLWWHDYELKILTMVDSRFAFSVHTCSKAADLTHCIDVPAEGLYNRLVLVAFEALDDHLMHSRRINVTNGGGTCALTQSQTTKLLCFDQNMFTCLMCMLCCAWRPGQLPHQFLQPPHFTVCELLSTSVCSIDPFKQRSQISTGI